MSISAIASPTSPYQPAGAQNSRQQFTQLVQSLQSGDLSGAQQAYASLTQGNSQGTSGASDPVSKALSQIGQSLQSGDLAGAQQALSTLQQQTQAQGGPQQVGGHHHHHHHASGGEEAAPSASTTAAAPSATSGANAVNVTI